MNDKLLDIFMTEAQDLINDLEKALLLLEKDQHNAEGIGTIFRAMHTLKGSAGMFGFDAVNHITHHLENIYQDIRDGKKEMNGNILGTTFQTLDHLRNILLDPQLKQGAVKETHESLLTSIILLAKDSVTKKDAAHDEDINISSATSKSTYYISFLGLPGILKKGTNPLYLVDDLHALGSAMCFPFFHQLPALEQLVPNQSYTGFEIILSTDQKEDDIRAVFIFSEDDCDIIVHKVADGDLVSSLNRDSQLLKKGRELTPFGFEHVRSVLLLDTKKTSVIPDTISIKAKASSIRVSADRLDDLMNLVSELVTTQARLSLYSNEHTSAELENISENVEKITRRLRDNAFTMSLIPLDNLVVRFERLIRDLSKELSKEIEFRADGSDTEIDKSISEKLTDPLLHLLRNSIDHGIEKPADREKAGKPLKGTVLLKSYYSGANVIIEISDDGAGIDLHKVKAKAISNGIIDAKAELTEKELLDLIFLPGFSTASQVTAVSGRGVGMDVVRRNILDLRGDIEVKSTPGKGTTFTIRLPLTLSIIDGLLVRIGDTDFILPLSSVVKCYEVETRLLESSYNQCVTLEGKRTPFLFLRDDFGITHHKPVLSQIINVPYEGGYVGLTVDKIIGEYQAVLKPLGKFYTGQDEFSGATILGNGTVALVLDPNRLIRKINIEHKNSKTYESAY